MLLAEAVEVTSARTETYHFTARKCHLCRYTRKSNEVYNSFISCLFTSRQITVGMTTKRSSTTCCNNIANNFGTLHEIVSCYRFVVFADLILIITSTV